MKKITFSILFVWLSLSLWAARQPEFSTAGFFRLDNSGREVYSMNPAWRFHKGAVEGAETKEFNDKDWTVVSLPDGIEYLPTEASGCINYQGEVWYRKHFTPDAALKGKKLFLHFEAIMGKSKVFVNGKLLTEHFGGYLPVIADVTDVLDWNGDNVIAVWADNSDDPSYPPGKAQDVLDYTYFGGIYRDCWLIAHNNVFITDPNYENEVAGGGLFVAFGKVSDALAEVQLKIHVRNATKNPFSGRVEYMLLQPDGTEVARLSDKIQVKAVFFFDGALVTSGRRNPAWGTTAFTLMELPDKTKPGAWSELYKDKIAQAKIEAGRYEKIVQGIRTAEAEALRNRYTLQVYEQTNNLQNYPVRLILALNAYDTAKDDAAREAALEKVAEVCSYFDVMRSNLESVYSETRFMEQPEGFISDLNHHNHLASKTNNSDWWYYYEIPMVKKVRAWMK